MPNKTGNTPHEPSRLRQAVTDAARLVLESMCFADVIGQSEEEPMPSPLAVEVRFHGTENGVFRMWIPEMVSRRLAADFLGAEEAGEEEARQVALELANMICGSAVSHLGCDGELRLDPPRLLETESSPGEATEMGAARIEMDSGILALALEEFPPEEPPA